MRAFPQPEQPALLPPRSSNLTPAQFNSPGTRQSRGRAAPLAAAAAGAVQVLRPASSAVQTSLAGAHKGPKRHKPAELEARAVHLAPARMSTSIRFAVPSAAGAGHPAATQLFNFQHLAEAQVSRPHTPYQAMSKQPRSLSDAPHWNSDLTPLRLCRAPNLAGITYWVDLLSPPSSDNNRHAPDGCSASARKLPRQAFKGSCIAAGGWHRTRSAAADVWCVQLWAATFRACPDGHDRASACAWPGTAHQPCESSAGRPQRSMACRSDQQQPACCAGALRWPSCASWLSSWT